MRLRPPRYSLRARYFSAMDHAPTPILIGLLYDFPQGDGGAGFEEALRLGLDDVVATGRLDRTVDFVSNHARGLPSGSEHEMRQGFAEIEASGALVMIGP